MGPAGLYRMKPAWQRLLRPVADSLVHRGVRADALTALAVPVAALGGACLALSDRASVLLLAVPFLAAARLILNLLDGQVARGGGTARPMGEVWNELCDRLADVLMLGGLAFAAAVGPMLAGAGIIAALLASYVGVTSRAVGGPRQYGGVMSKPGRMIVVAIAAPLAFAQGAGWPLTAAAVLIAVGAAITLVQRLMATSASVGHGGE